MCIRDREKELIKYELVNFEFDSDGIPRIITEGNVQLIFTQNSTGIVSILKVSKFVRLNSNQIKMKQINFSIPEVEYQKLREQAIETRKSIQNICKEIILDKLNKNKNYVEQRVKYLSALIGGTALSLVRKG